ncbi:MAG: flagellar motor switch protein FliN [Acidimicrobiia bacterium]|nr:flagellar motor switch protein FliN [Acidimicrobiia bacterium]
MPTATVDTARISALLQEAAEASARGLLMPSLGAGYVGEGTQPSEFLPGDDARAISARMRGLEGTIVLVMASAMVEDLLNGPLGNQELPLVVEGALRAAGAVLDRAAPRALRLELPMEVDAAGVFEAAETAWSFLPVPLFDGEEHRASLVVFLDDPEVLHSAQVVADSDDEMEETIPYPSSPLETEVTAMSSAMGAIATTAGATAPLPLLGPSSLKLIKDVEMDITVELGRTKMAVRNILSLVPGSVIELDRAAGAPVDLLVNGTLIGRGEVVVIDEEFGVRISEIIGRTED